MGLSPPQAAAARGPARSPSRQVAEALSASVVRLIASLFDLEARARPTEPLDGRPVEPQTGRARDVVEPACRVVRAAGVLLDEILSAYDGVEEKAAREVADLAFMGRHSLKEHLARLERVDPNAQRWRALQETSGALREAMKCLTAVEQALAAHGGFFSKNRFADVRLEQSLEVRRAFARFRAQVRSARLRAEVSMSAGLLAAGVALDGLSRAPIHEHLRIGDRLQLGAFKGRLLDWLSVHVWGERAPSAEPRRDGARILSDLEGFAELLRQVSLRAELVAHDVALLSRVLVLLPEDDRANMPAELVEFLGLLVGLDDELDALLELPAAPTALWRPCLARVLDARTS